MSQLQLLFIAKWHEGITLCEIPNSGAKRSWPISS